MVGSYQRTFSQTPIIFFFCEIPSSPAVNNSQPHLLAGQNPAERAMPYVTGGGGKALHAARIWIGIRWYLLIALASVGFAG